MKRPIFVRPLSDAERESLEAGLRSPDAFTSRRCQILLASHRGENAYQIAHQLGCNPQTARNAIHTFNEKGLPEALQPGSKHPHTVHRAFDPEQAEALREMLHRSPREFGRESSLWTLEMAAEVAFEEGLVERPISGETIRATLVRLLGIRGTRAKRWITSPDPLCERKKAARSTDGSTDGSGPGQSRQLGGWFLGRVLVESAGLAHFEQLERAGKASSSPPEVGRQRRPRAEGHLLLRALCAPTRPDVDQVRGWEPISSITTQFLSWSLQKLQAAGKKVMVLIWDNASWHISKEVRRWLGRHNRHVKESGEGVRIVSCLLPKHSPWLNAIEPKWIHGKRKVVEPDGDDPLGAYELAERVCRVFDCPHYEHLSIAENAA